MSHKVFIFLVMLSTLLVAATLRYDEEFKSMIKEMVASGDLSSIGTIECAKGDCSVLDVTTIMTDEKSGLFSTLSIKKFTLQNGEEFLLSKAEEHFLKEGEKQHFGIIAEDIQEDAHSLLFNEEKMQKLYTKESATYKYFKKYFDAPTNLHYSADMYKHKGNDHIQDAAALEVGAFTFGLKGKYTILGGLEIFNNVEDENYLEALSAIIINEIDFKIRNPKGFLRELIYINYKEQMMDANSSEVKEQINETYYLSGEKNYTQDALITSLQKNLKIVMQESDNKKSPLLSILNHNQQLSRKVEAILEGTSESIVIKIENKKRRSLADIMTLYMGYSMQGKLLSDPEITITIR